MSYQPNRPITIGDSASIDAFARLRTSEPYTIFDSKQIVDNQPLFWDDVQVSGAGTNSVHSTNLASSTMSVSNLTAGKRIRRTFQRFNYQPGKSQLVLLTFSNMLTTAGNTKWVQLGDDNNAYRFEHKNGVASFILRDFTTGVALETQSITQANWNLDKMLDGTGPSGITLDFTKTQIFILDYEWLGVGRVRMGFVIDGIPMYCHEFLNANSLTNVYLSTPNLPIEYGIQNDGTGPADSMQHICSSVMSEGGQQQLGMLRYASCGTTFLAATVVGTLYAALGIRLKSTHSGISVQLTDIVNLCITSDDAEMILMWNPTIAGVFTYNPVAGSAVEIAIGAGTNTVTGGVQIAGRHVIRGSSPAHEINTLLALGSSVAGVMDQMVVCIRPLTINLEMYTGINWRELS